MNRIETEEGEYGWRQAGAGTVTGSHPATAAAFCLLLDWRPPPEYNLPHSESISPWWLLPGAGLVSTTSGVQLTTHVDFHEKNTKQNVKICYHKSIYDNESISPRCFWLSLVAPTTSGVQLNTLYPKPSLAKADFQRMSKITIYQIYKWLASPERTPWNIEYFEF